MLPSLDDSIAEQGQSHAPLIEQVDWHYDHLESQKGRAPLQERLELPGLHGAGRFGGVDLRHPPYLWERTVRRPNRERPKDQRLHFISKTRLAQRILRTLVPLLPMGRPVYVHFARVQFP